jgi:hypothetical protein
MLHVFSINQVKLIGTQTVATHLGIEGVGISYLTLSNPEFKLGHPIKPRRPLAR